MADIIKIIERIKERKVIKSDTAVADMLGMNQSTFAERKRKNSVPYEELEAFCLKEGISFDWLLTGEGDIKRPSDIKYSLKETVSENCAPYHTKDDPDIHEIVELLEHDLPELKKYLLRFLRGTKERKEGAQGLGIPDRKLTEEEG